MSIQLFDLTGKTALITGGTHGLGMAIATGLANAGATIVINDLSPEKLEIAKKDYSNLGVSVHTYNFNVTDESQIQKALEQIEQEVGPIDILVNNAGIIKRIPIIEMKVQEFRDVIEVDLIAPFDYGQSNYSRDDQTQTRQNY
jgi:gluconate 5-dehydrogenase